MQHTINYNLNGSDAEGLASMTFTVTGADAVDYFAQTWTLSGTSQTRAGSINLPALPQTYTAKLSVVDSNGAVAEQTHNFSTVIQSTNRVPLGQIAGIASTYTRTDNSNERIEYTLVGLDDNNLSKIDFRVVGEDGQTEVVESWTVGGTYVEKRDNFLVPSWAKSYTATLTLTDLEGNQQDIRHVFTVFDGSDVQMYQMSAQQQDNYDLQVKFSLYEVRHDSRLQARIFLDNDANPFTYLLSGGNDSTRHHAYTLNHDSVMRKLSGEGDSHFIRVEVHDLANSDRQPDSKTTYFDYFPRPVPSDPNTGAPLPLPGDLSISGLSARQTANGDLSLNFTPYDPLRNTLAAYLYLNDKQAFHYRNLSTGHRRQSTITGTSVQKHACPPGGCNGSAYTLRVELYDTQNASRTATATTNFTFIPESWFENAPAEPPPTARPANRPPEIVRSVAKPRRFAQGSTTSLEVVWQDPEGDPVGNVAARYRKKNSSDPWQDVPEKLKYDSNTNPPQFSSTFQFTGAAGEYDMQFRAVDRTTGISTGWQTAAGSFNDFIVNPMPSGVENLPPHLYVEQPLPLYAEPGEQLELILFGTDPNSNLQKIAVNWNDGDSSVFEQSAVVGTFYTFRHTYHKKGVYTVTARAYDGINAGSWELKSEVHVGISPTSGIAGNIGKIDNNDNGGNTPNEPARSVKNSQLPGEVCGSGDPVDTSQRCSTHQLHPDERQRHPTHCIDPHLQLSTTRRRLSW